jgi:hypothetical protein
VRREVWQLEKKNLDAVIIRPQFAYYIYRSRAQGEAKNASSGSGI